MRPIWNNGNFDPFEQGMTQSVEECSTNVVAQINDTLQKSINILDRASVHKSFQVFQQIIIHGIVVGIPWLPCQGCSVPIKRP